MTTATVIETRRNGNPIVGERVELARYSTPAHIDGPATEWDYELYDRHNDPHELTNLAHQAGTSTLINQLNALVDELTHHQLTPIHH